MLPLTAGIVIKTFSAQRLKHNLTNDYMNESRHDNNSGIANCKKFVSGRFILSGGRLQKTLNFGSNDQWINVLYQEPTTTISGTLKILNLVIFHNNPCDLFSFNYMSTLSFSPCNEKNKHNKMNR